ncbi:SAGA-associated factor 73 [Hyphodiscus hymeniophilus]|uniref:SAGA-associated factor 73 n=1 Tax=Hyphodiscus hymeniophilus TaxID=353542 RepID=A0A9P7AVK9_9HELO|nr:SAGA-associated factor 73 [Hyphodiscus hymeniophilus]
MLIITPSSASLGSDNESTIKVAPTKKDGKEKSLKLKKSAPKQSKPGNWRDGSVIDEDKKKGTDTPSTNSVPASPGTIVNQLDDSAKDTFATGRPLEDTPKIQQCRHCKRNILNTAITAHLISCLKAKKEKAQRKKEQKEARDRERKGIDVESKKDEDGDRMEEDDDDAEDDSPDKKGLGGMKSTKKSAGKKLEIESKGKKRKADGDAEKGPKQKKKKEEPKPKAPKPKGPVDVERQCGVIIKEGVQCARSLTCKSHSMGAKRAVPGRSLPYDMLLAAYQKKNQAKQQKAAIDANAPLEDEEEGNGPYDSDEELQGVMNGLANWNPQPVVIPEPLIPIQRKYQKAALYEQLRQATNNFQVNIFEVKGYSYQKLPPGHPGLASQTAEEADAEGDVVDGEYGFLNPDYRRTSTNMQVPPSRRASLVSQANQQRPI